MHGPYCIHIWHSNLQCGFAKNVTTITWRVLVKSKQTNASLTLSSHGGVNGFVKLEMCWRLHISNEMPL